MATKQLASELGLLRKRPLLLMSPQQRPKRQNTGQVFTHLIVLDFESTCWETDRTSPQEIIEFPAVLLNTQTGQIESEFHYFLQPSERHVLSDFCQKLTGITQDQVDNGIPLSLCLRKFAAWLRKLHVDKGVVCSGDKSVQVTRSHIQTSRPDPSQAGNTALVTWSDWDLGVCLLYETRRKQISRPPSLTEWIDLRATYKAFYGRKPAGLNGALNELGIIFDGRQHSGLDDARNTARLAWQMIQDGCLMSITKAVRTSLTGRIEHQSMPPAGPPLASLQPDTPASVRSNRACPATAYTGAGTPFLIAHDTEESAQFSCREVGAHLPAYLDASARTDPQTRTRHRDTSVHTLALTRKGLSQRNLNLLPATDAAVTGKQLTAGAGRQLTAATHMTASKIPVLTQGSNPNRQTTSECRILSDCPSLCTHVGIIASNQSPRSHPQHGASQPQLAPVQPSHFLSQVLPGADNQLAATFPDVWTMDAKSVCGEVTVHCSTLDTAAVSCYSNHPPIAAASVPSSAGPDSRLRLSEANPLTASADVQDQPASSDTSATLYRSFTSLKTPLTSLETPTATLKTPSTSLETPTATLKTPYTQLKTLSAELKTPATAFKTPVSTLKIPTPSNTTLTAATFNTPPPISVIATTLKTSTTTLKTPTTTLKTPTTTLKTPTTTLKTPVTTLKSQFATFKTPSTLETSVSKLEMTSIVTSDTSSNTTNTSLLTLSTSFKTPRAVSPATRIHVTPPLCSCGRRSKCRIVQKLGPNTGRWFFSCSATRDRHSGCTFFQWASPGTPAQSLTPASSRSLGVWA